MDDMVSRKAVIDAVHTATYGFICGAEDGDEMTEADKLVLSINKAVCTAIKALPSVQPEHLVKESGNLVKGLVNDCIDRQAARDALNQLSRDNFSLGDWFQTYLTALIAADDAIQSLPSVQPQRWIPVTERLPEHSGFYIVTAIVTDDGGKLVGLRWFSQEHGWKFGKNPLAWMPLPEPWRGGQNETN